MKDIVSSFTATALIQASNIGSGILLARFLQPDGRGELAAVMLWPSMIAAIGILGLHEAVAYHAARRGHAGGQILRASLALGFALSLILVPIGAVLMGLVFADHSPEVRRAAFLYLAFIPLNFAGLFLVGAFQGALRFGEWNMLRTLVHVAYLILIPVLHVAGLGGVLGFALASLAANLALVLAACLLVGRAGWFRQDGSPSSQPSPVARGLLRYGATVHAGAVVGILAERLDQLVISVVLSAADLGLFVVATTVARLPIVIASTFATVAFPKIAGAPTDDERTKVFGRYARATMLGVLAAALVLAAVLPWLVPLFFGASFAAAVPITWVLAAGAVPLSLKMIAGAGLKACDRALLVGQAEVVTLGLSAAGLALLVPSYGLMGAAAASTIAQSGALMFLLYRAQRTLGLSPKTLLLPGRGDLTPLRDIVSTLRGRLGRRVGES